MNFHTVVKRARKPFGALLAQSDVHVLVKDGLVHAGSQWYCAQGGVRVQMSLSALAEKKACPNCARRLPLGGQTGIFLSAWVESVEMVKSLRSTTHTDAVFVMRRRMEKGEAMALQLETEARKVPLSSSEEDEVAFVAGALREACQSVRNQLLSGTGRERVYQQVREALGKDEEFVFDQSPTLMGITQWSERVTGLLKVMVIQFGIRKGECIVLVVPRYVADYLFLSQRGECTLASSATLREGESDAVAEVAAGLWEPEGSGVMRSLVAALDAARQIV